jgi:hypothetical protein
MSTASVWDIDLGGAVMGVTRRRDGFCNSPDERSKEVRKKMRRFATVEGQILGENAEIVHFFHMPEEVLSGVSTERKM